MESFADSLLCFPFRAEVEVERRFPLSARAVNGRFFVSEPGMIVRKVPVLCASRRLTGDVPGLSVSECGQQLGDEMLHFPLNSLKIHLFSLFIYYLRSED